MREKLFIVLALGVLVVILIGLNAASYVQREKMPDTELFPNRSTYNTGATGTRAFYDLLSETGKKVARWQEPPAALLTAKNAPATFIVIGHTRRPFEENEIKDLLEWVSLGGKLVIIDREPLDEFLVTKSPWTIAAETNTDAFFVNPDPTDQKQMTDQTVAGKPVQPTVFTVNINAVQPSRLAAAIGFTRGEEEEREPPKRLNMPRRGSGEGSGETNDEPLPRQLTAQGNDATPPKIYKMPTPASATPLKSIETEKPKGEIISADSAPVGQNAPVVHIANDQKNLLIDFPYGAGTIVYLSDPYIVANNGIGAVDNARLGVNIVSSREGLIAFDEYHQGFGTNQNQLLAFFSGTPVVPIVLQLALLIGVIFYSQSRRFARPLPEAEPDRLSSLEYVAAMAELQRRTKGYDLAIENIYNDFRRRVARSFGVDNRTTTRREMADLIAERTGLERNETEDLLFKCEDIMHGEPTTKKQVVELTSRLREMEEKLGLQRRKRRTG